jgi:hypothetical protein
MNYFAFGAKALILPVTLSSKRIPIATRRSDSCIDFVRIISAMHPRHPEGEFVRPRKTSKPHKRHGDRHIRIFSEFLQFLDAPDRITPPPAMITGFWPLQSYARPE